MAFDEEGQAATEEDKVRICKRSYDILVDKVRFPPEDIIFDCNVPTIATGLADHNSRGIDFVQRLPVRLAQRLPQQLVVLVPRPLLAA